MLENLEPVVRKALIRVLADVFETGLVTEVDMGLVVQLFGVPAEEVQDLMGTMVSNNDEEFLQEYMQLMNEDAEEVMAELFDVEVVDMNTGETSFTQMSHKELESLNVDNPEDLPEKPKRVLH